MEKNIIWNGHHRARAAGAAGIKQVPIVLLEKPPEVMESFGMKRQKRHSNLDFHSEQYDDYFRRSFD